METRLTMKERELVAVGASVAAGCVPCTQYHVGAVRAEHATNEEILRAVDVALCVKDASARNMRGVAFAALGLDQQRDGTGCCGGAGSESRRNTPEDRPDALVALGAAVAVNSPACFAQHAATARGLGVRDDEIQIVVGFARMIRAKASEKMDAEVAAAAHGKPALSPQPGSRPATSAPPAAGCCGPSSCG